MSTDLAAELTELLAVDVSVLSATELTAHVGRLERARTRFDAASLGVLSAFDDSGAWQTDAAYGASNWLSVHTGTSKAVARARVRLAGHLKVMPGTAHALSEGRITEAHARVLARCVANPRTRADFAWAENRLVADACACTADELAEKVRAWIEEIDQDGSEPFDPSHDTVSANRVGDRVKVNADLGLATGIPFLAALDERVDQLFRRDQAVLDANPDDGLAVRTPGNRRAEALTELVAAGAGAESNPRRREPLFNVFVDQQTLRENRWRVDTISQLADGTVIPIKILSHWKCEALMSRVVLDARRAVLELGRTERYANRAQRRALLARDRGCAIPGCDRPPEQCDAHHIQFWEDFGDTDIDNLVLLCRHHHRAIHAGHLRVEMVGGVPRFYDSFDRLVAAGRYRPPEVQAA